MFLLLYLGKNEKKNTSVIFDIADKRCSTKNLFGVDQIIMKRL